MRRKDRQIKDIRDLELIISQSDVCRVAQEKNSLLTKEFLGIPLYSDLILKK